jgi:hypothetical protein
MLGTIHDLLMASRHPTSVHYEKAVVCGLCPSLTSHRCEARFQSATLEFYIVSDPKKEHRY